MTDPWMHFGIITLFYKIFVSGVKDVLQKEGGHERKKMDPLGQDPTSLPPMHAGFAVFTIVLRPIF